MNPLSILRDHGLSAKVIEVDKLFVTPKDRLNDELRAYIRQHKPEIVAALSRWSPDLAVSGFVWCLDCVHFQSVESQGAMLWKYAVMESTCTHQDNPHRAQNPLAPRHCELFQTQYKV